MGERQTLGADQAGGKAPALATCLWFNDQALQAAEFYVALLPASAITHISYRGNDPAHGAFTVDFTLLGQRYWALNGGAHYALSPAVSISLHLDSQAEIDHYWAALLAGGGRESRCGWLTDRFGLSWQILPRILPQLLAQDAQGHVMQVLMQSVKFDIAALMQAAARA
jgi:predicted 3-demethylubiquinone-9 3-methyltransferase (glyoxalase superfamily)